MRVQLSGSDTVLERSAWLLVAVVIGLIAREGWQAWRARQDGRASDRLILSALLREVATIRGIANSIVRDIERERELLEERLRWRLKPVVSLPTGTYELMKTRAPNALLQQAGAFIDLIRLQTQCAYTNALANEQQKWKTPAANGQADQVETIRSFHTPILESVTTVIERCDRLTPAIRAAGEKVGGLNLEGPPNQAKALAEENTREEQR